MRTKTYRNRKPGRKNAKKNMQPILGVLVLIASLFTVGGVFAYLSDADVAVNQVTVGGNRVDLIEEFTPPAKLEPGISFAKDVKVSNVGPSDCFVRIKAVFTDSDMEKYCTVDFNTRDYEYNETDGYYYYKKVLKSEEETPSLFTTVSLSESIPADEIRDFDILVYTETYQSYGFDDYEDAWNHYHRNKPE